MIGFTVTLNCTNAAFDINPELEVARILREIATALEQGTVITPRDHNGNRVGSVEVIGE
jgi:hypothetical protein